MTRMNEHHEAVLHAVREGVLIIDAEGRLLLANDEARRLLDLPSDAELRHVGDLGLDPPTAALLASGRIATDEVHRAGDRLLAVNVRPTKPYGGRPSGTVTTLRDSTELAALSGRAAVARDRLQLLYDAGVRIGTTLDVVRTAEELSEVAVPRFADFVTVELLEPVLRGEEPGGGVHTEMRRAAISGIRVDSPLQPVGDVIRFVVPTAPMSAALDAGRAVLAADLNCAFGWRAQDHDGTRVALDYGLHSLISVPLQARGVVLGMANFWRADTPEPFDEEDLSFAEELAARAAVSIDNARRFTREHAVAVTLQRSLLPRVLPDLSAVDVAFRYLPAKAGVGGDWFDVIPLAGARVALVVGDVVGHGVHAAATMGRLRTAVHNFSTLDMPPDELLGHLDELIDRIDQDESSAEEGSGERESSGVTGATCLYAVYDPVSGHCAMASAGHPGPALVGPDGRVAYPELPIGLPLGVGGMPFEAVELRLPEASRLVLFTDGLLEDRDRDFDTGLALLTEALSRPDRSPDQACSDVLASLLFPAPSDDIALLIADTRRLPAEQIAEWEVRPDPSDVSRVRRAGSAQLTAWGLGDVTFTAELILSELITNAIRYGTPPIRVRLLRDRTLICEISDGSSTSPHLRYAATTDEGGRGLFLVAQYAERWGTRYTDRGKVIWAELPLTGAAERRRRPWWTWTPWRTWPGSRRVRCPPPGSEPGGQPRLRLRPFGRQQGEVHAVAPGAVRAAAVTAQDAFALRSEAGDGGLGAGVEVVRLELDPAHAEVFEGVGEQEQLGLGVDGAAPVRAPVPGPADLQAFVGRADVQVRGPAHGPAASEVDDGEGDVLAALRRLQHGVERGAQLLLRPRRGAALPAPHLLVPAAGRVQVGEVTAGERLQADVAAGKRDGGRRLGRRGRGRHDEDASRSLR